MVSCQEALGAGVEACEIQVVRVLSDAVLVFVIVLGSLGESGGEHGDEYEFRARARARRHEVPWRENWLEQTPLPPTVGTSGGEDPHPAVVRIVRGAAYRICQVTG